MKILQKLRDWAVRRYCVPRLNFGVALGLVAIATLLNLLAWPSGSDQDGHYFALVAAVLISALYGGLGPGLVGDGTRRLEQLVFYIVAAVLDNGCCPRRDQNVSSCFIFEGVLLSLAAHVIRNQHKSATPNVGLQRYLAIPLAVGAATIPKLVFPDLARELPFAFNYAAVCACAWTGGLVSGIAAIGLLAGVTKYLFLEPVYSLSVANQADAIRVGLFVAEGLLLAVLGDSHAKLKRLAANASARARAYHGGSSEQRTGYCGDSGHL